ncbi:MAG: peptide deformylase [Lachnospiraceae bacterium]|nr:peptide deformylase [Lachnospiraceae bacterium]MBQ8547960.1 peptide deformylase [Lachnospiraceae bacterium]MBQ8845593.1 peptide deformylase [Lachnospiraceae bacterium]
MALRKIRTLGDPILQKVSKPITEVNEKIKELAYDMLDTMYTANGVGLAAPQIGVLKRIVVIDVSPEGDKPIVLINPEIIAMSGTQSGEEGCLSVPGKSGCVTRPNEVTVRAYNLKMQPIELTGNELLARALCHEIDHLDGVVYVEKVEGELHDVVPQE